MDFHTTQSVTDHSRLHFPSSTAPTQLSALITHTPANNITQSPSPNHTHTHTLHKPWTFSHSLPSIVSLVCIRSVFLVSSLDFLCSDSLPVLLVYCLCLALWILFADRDPRLPLDYSCVCPCHTCLLLLDPACSDHV